MGARNLEGGALAGCNSLVRIPTEQIDFMHALSHSTGRDYGQGG